MIVWLSGACAGVIPLFNEAPELVSFNGVERWTEELVVREVPPAGEDWEIWLEVDDPEGDAVRVWFPYSAGWVEFDPDAREGVWHVPDGGAAALTVLLEDDRDPPARRAWEVAFAATGE